MATPIIMLLLMAAPYAIARLISFIAQKQIDAHKAAAIGLGLLFIFTGIGHFTQTEPMSRMLPAWVPRPITIIYLTGVLELLMALGFFLPKTRRLTGILAIIFLIASFPANIYAAVNRVDMGGHAWGPIYLLIRAPLQFLILLWTYYFTVRSRN